MADPRGRFGLRGGRARGGFGIDLGEDVASGLGKGDIGAFGGLRMGSALTGTAYRAIIESSSREDPEVPLLFGEGVLRFLFFDLTSSVWYDRSLRFSRIDPAKPTLISDSSSDCFSIDSAEYENDSRMRISGMPVLVFGAPLSFAEF